MHNLFYGNSEALDLQKMREDAKKYETKGEPAALHHHGAGMTCNNECEVYDGTDNSASKSKLQPGVNPTN